MTVQTSRFHLWSKLIIRYRDNHLIGVCTNECDDRLNLCL